MFLIGWHLLRQYMSQLSYFIGRSNDVPKLMNLSFMLQFLPVVRLDSFLQNGITNPNFFFQPSFVSNVSVGNLGSLAVFLVSLLQLESYFHFVFFWWTRGALLICLGVISGSFIEIFVCFFPAVNPHPSRFGFCSTVVF